MQECLFTVNESTSLHLLKLLRNECSVPSLISLLYIFLELEAYTCIYLCS